MTWHRSLRRRLSVCLIALLILPVEALASTGQTNTQGPATQQSSNQTNVPDAPAAQTSEQKPGQAPAPSGTAAAPDTHMDGVAASTPSGAAIAPGKQRRVRKFSVRTALIVGAVVAVGIVVGVSAATSSRP